MITIDTSKNNKYEEIPFVLYHLLFTEPHRVTYACNKWMNNKAYEITLVFIQHTFSYFEVAFNNMSISVYRDVASIEELESLAESIYERLKA